MLLKIESCAFNKVIDNIATVSFIANAEKNNLHNMVKKEYNVELILAHEIHSNIALVVSRDQCLAKGNAYEGDALITQNANIAVGIVTADCVPVLLVDINNHIIAAAHAGWRGARHGIIENTIKKITSLAKSLGKSAKIAAIIGPCIRRDNYEIQQELFDDFMDEDRSNIEFFIKNNGKQFFDLPLYVKHKLKSSGVNNVHDTELDTYTSPAFTSYRRDHNQNTEFHTTHTNLSIIMLKQKIYGNKVNEEYAMSALIPQTKDIRLIKSNKIDLADTKKYESKNVQYTSGNSDNLINFHPNINCSQSFGPIEKKQILKKIQMGKVHVSQTLDLHGHTIQDAFEALQTFVRENFDLANRYLLVVTGKGKGGDCTMKTSFIDWAQNNHTLEQYILTYIEALAHHGGGGAFYLILRKNQR